MQKFTQTNEVLYQEDQKVLRMFDTYDRVIKSMLAIFISQFAFLIYIL